jgi:hypothetical protein
MKKINLVQQFKIFVIILFMFSTILYSQSISGTGFISGGHDSLLFDGANSSFIKSADICKVRVMQVSGLAFGTICVKKNTDNICTGKDTLEVCKEGQIYPDDELKAGDKISTGPNGYLVIMLSDGKRISFAHNTSMVLNSNYCDNNFATQVLLDEGELYINGRPNKNIKGINVITEFGTAVVEGTVYSYGIIKEGGITTDVLKVYEGSVKFQKNMQNESNKKKSQDKAAELKKLTEDYQSGKISPKNLPKRWLSCKKK